MGGFKSMMTRMRGIGMGGRMGGPMMGGGEMMRPGAFGNPFGGLLAKPAAKKHTAARTEFSLIFVWREWTPSDDLLNKSKAAEGTTTEGK
jgi:hypothetical protein